MAMTKVIPPGSFGFSEPTSQLVKTSSRGLRGNDLSVFIKRAGHCFSSFIHDNPPRDDETWIHLLAIGCTENYNPNRNGDGFTKKACRSDHPTFVKVGRFYRSHANKDPSKSYGIIKASVFNEPMGRIELLVALNSTKEAAQRNGGLIADKELEKLAKDEDIGVSMASRVPYDVCSSCNNKAKTREFYCTEKTCEHGGLKHNIGRVFDDGHILHADNPVNVFFDMSHVVRPADRIAYALGKAASSTTVGGAELAEQMEVVTPDHVLAADQASPAYVTDRLKLAMSLAKDKTNLDSLWHAGPRVQMPANIKLSHALRALADERVILPPGEFIRMLHDSKLTDEQLEKYGDCVWQTLPEVYTDKLAELSEQLLSDPQAYSPAETAPPLAARVWAASLVQHYSADQRHVEKRAWKAALQPAEKVEKRANVALLSDSEQRLVKSLAVEYVLYKLAYVDYCSKNTCVSR